MADIINQADDILAVKQWADLSFDDIISMLQENAKNKPYDGVINNDIFTDYCKKFYDHVASEWVDKNFAIDGAPDNGNKAIQNSYKLAMCFGFMLGYGLGKDKIPEFTDV